MQNKIILITIVLITSLLACINTNKNIVTAINGDSLFIAENYTKNEYFVEMRDRVKLFTSVYSPKDKSKTYPILFKRTPYSCIPYGENNLAESIGSSMKLVKDLYIFVYQDVRGKFMSEGEFEDVRPLADNYNDSTKIDESTDAWDSIDWLIKNIKNNNGKLGMWGNSYPGFYAAMALINAHPAYIASTPQCPVTDWFFEDFHHNGAFLPAHYFNFGQYFGQVRTDTVKEWPAPLFEFNTDDGYEFYLENAIPLSKINKNLYYYKIAFWDTLMEHPNYDKFWQKRSLITYLKDIKPAVLTIGGWFDAEDLYGPLHVFEAIEKSTENNNNKIVMGPWIHGGFARGNGSTLGNVFFGNSPAPSDYYRDSIEFPFFKYYLKGEGNLDLPKALMFETGNNKWQAFNEWPPKNSQTEKLFFHKNGDLNTQIPINQEFNEFISNPKNPVPYTEAVSTKMTKEYMTDDQRFADKREDVISYKTIVLDNDKTIAGKIKVCLYVSTNQSDADWIVKLIDVYPDNFKNFEHNPDSIKMAGYQQMLRSEVFRGRYRNSLEKPEAFVPNKITKVKFELQDVLHTFKKGHKLMVQVQSTWFPLVDVNPQKYVDNIYKAKEEDFVKATHKIYCSKDNASYIEIRVL
ncbi:MAG: CocE/NonD family hydrolase [Bacteroidales bacterium]|nr:CocE/NonD family hydrolase [Bacteroidales bacterium]MBN2757484.1 CocE/NonD family hydrolase [Bacteroidales bacterium]